MHRLPHYPQLQKIALVLLAILLATPVVLAQYPADRIDSLMTIKHRSGAFNGTTLVAVEGSIIYRKAFGIAEDDRSLEPQTPFYLGSLAKAFTGMAIMILSEEENLSYDDKVNTLIPELPALTRDITIRNLLNHTSGLPDYYGLGKYKDGMTNKMVQEVILQLDSLDFSAGSQYAYSNTGYVLLSLIIERVSGQSFRQFVKERIFEPLGMEHSEIIDGTQGEMMHKARGHTETGESNDYKAFTTGAGGIYSQVDDLYLWDQALYGEKLVTQGTLAEAFAPAVLTNGETSWYGFGWRLNESNPKVVEHSGSLVGFRTYLYRDTDNKNTIILLSNFTNDVGAIKEEIVRIIGE